MDTESGWKTYDALCKIVRLTNRENDLPEDWNIPPDVTQKRFGDRPANIAALSDTDSAVEFSDESESEESEDSDDLDGIDGLESRMLKEYSSLSRGKVLYWWLLGTGTQVFVRYGSKRAPIYRVRAGSSQPYDPQVAERVLSKTRGNNKYWDPNTKMELWEYTRDQVLDIIGVGWKIDDDDETGTNPLALIRPRKDAAYPHTRVLVKWWDGNISLERRGFVRRIAHGNCINGDRMIYLKAKELESAYRGYNIEEESDSYTDSDTDGETSDTLLKRSDHSRRSGKSSSRHRRGVHFKESDREESDADSESSQSSFDSAQITRRSRRVHDKNSRPSNKDREVDAEIRHLTKELDRLKVKRERSSSGN